MDLKIKKNGFTLVEVMAAVGVLSIVLFTITQVTLMGIRLARQTESDLKDQIDRSLMRFYLNRYLPYAMDLESEPNIANMRNCCAGVNGMGKVISRFSSNDYFERDEAYPLMIFNRYGPVPGAGVRIKATGLYFVPPKRDRGGVLIVAESTDGVLDYTKSVIKFDNVIEVNIPTLMTTVDSDGKNKVLSVPIEIITRKSLDAGTGKKISWCPRALSAQCDNIVSARVKDESNDILINVLNNNLGLSTSLTGDQCFRTLFIDPLHPAPMGNDFKWFRQRIPARKHSSTFYFPLRMPGSVPINPGATVIDRVEL